MELSLPRNHKGKGWQLDKARRWKSKAWRHWVRTLKPVRTPTDISAGFDIIVAAHFRYPGCGMGARPADCFVYPMHDADHKDAHGFGQPSLAEQWRWVTGTMMLGTEAGPVRATDEAGDWVCELYHRSKEPSDSISTMTIEAVAEQWARYFLLGELVFHSDYV